MQQYHDLLKNILINGVKKPPAREGMPGSYSLFGPQIEFDLSKGFPILTTKKIVFKHIVTELLWFLRGDTNIQYLNEHKFKMWNEDAYNYYKKTVLNWDLSFEDFIEKVKNKNYNNPHLYDIGDCGHQYGKVWRDFGGTDQIVRVLANLKNNPEGRRHIVTAVDPGNDDDLALYWCHSMFQFNASPLSFEERSLIGDKFIPYHGDFDGWLETNSSKPEVLRMLDDNNVPKYSLDCKMYQRSADVFLGVPYNISSYSLITFLFAKILNMVPGRYIHTFGDVHIYDDHMDQVDEILGNDVNKYTLPTLEFGENFENYFRRYTGEEKVNGTVDFGYHNDFDNFIEMIEPTDISLKDYQCYKFIKAKLSTGLK